MAQKPRTYRKLAGTGFSVLFKHFLWQGPDHLLYVERFVFLEHYKRFYFNDIETLVLSRTGRRTAWTLVLGVFFLLFASIVVFSEDVAYFSIFMAALFAILMAVQWLKGPGCKVYLQTAVQKYKLSNLVRIPGAIRVMDQIRAEVEAVQGPLDEQALADIRFSGMPPDTDTKTAGSYSLWMNWILYGLLFFFGLLRGAQLWLKSVPLAVADIVVLACTLVLAIIALARMGGRERSPLLSLSAWLTLVFVVIHAIAAYGVFTAAYVRAMESRESIYDNWAIIKNYFLLQVEAHPVIEAISIGVALVSIALGILGLYATHMTRSDRPTRMRPQASP